MSKRILVLVGSPRKKGNCDLLCDAFIRGAEEANHQVEKIYLQEKHIRGCQGCGKCQEEGVCVQDDDMKSVYDKLLLSDVVVLASPVYFDTWSSQMKAVIDRTTALEGKLDGKTFYLLAAGSSSAEGGAETLLDCFRKYICCFSEKNNEGGCVFAAGVNGPGEVENTSALKEAYGLGRGIG